MCGIAVVIGDIQGHEKLESTILHRGRTSGKFITPEIAMYHRRLHLCGTGGEQPVTDGRYVMVSNSEVYNWEELNEWGCSGDTDVLFNGLVKYGKPFLDRINGEFAIVLWDTKTKTTTTITDRFGIRPLFQFRDESRWIIASEIQSILALVDPIEDAESVEMCRNFRLPDGTRTCFQGISRISPASVNDTRWYDIREQDGCLHENQTLKTLLTDAIRIRQHPNSALLLSGGIDSFLIGCLGREWIKKAYTLESDEVPSAKKAAEKFGMDHITVPITMNQDAMVSCLEQPYYAYPPNWILAQAISEDVIFSGLGADECLGGYHYYKEPYSEEQYAKGHNLTGKGKRCYDTGGYTGIKAMNYIDLTHYLPFHHLYRGDKMYMSNTIESRYPFLDHRVVEYLFHLPDTEKGIEKKPLLKIALEYGYKPQPKRGLSLYKGNFEEIYHHWKKLFL